MLLVVTSVSYGLATGVQKVCDDLQPPEYHLLTEVADDPAVWGGVTLVGLISREKFTSTVNLSLSQILTYVHFTHNDHLDSFVVYTCDCSGCTENEAVWKALDGDRISTVNFDEDVSVNI